MRVHVTAVTRSKHSRMMDQLVRFLATQEIAIRERKGCCQSQPIRGPRSDTPKAGVHQWKSDVVVTDFARYQPLLDGLCLTTISLRNTFQSHYFCIVKHLYLTLLADASKNGLHVTIVCLFVC